MNTNKARFCTCADRKCPLHPANHDKGCTPCMKKNLRAGEVPSCLWNLVSTREERQREGCDYRIASFAEMVRRKNPNPSPRGKRRGRGIAELEQRAENGDGEAAWILGDAFADGGSLALPDGGRMQVRRDTDKAIRWLRLAVALGCTEAVCRLGVLLTDTGRKEAVEEGLKWLKRGWRMGSPEAAQNLAVAYSELGNPRRCVAWLRKSCQCADGADWFLLAIAHAAGYGVRKDLAEAARLFRKVRDDKKGFPVEREEAAKFLAMIDRNRPIRVTGSIGRTHPEDSVVWRESFSNR